jgi:hypothetical protein
MASLGGPNIITDSLVLHLDAANSKSYPGSGTTWNDLSRNQNNFSLINSPSYDGQSLIFNGSNQRADCINTTLGAFGTGSFTFEYILYTNGTGSSVYTTVICKRGKVTTIGQAGNNGFADRIGAGIFFAQDSNPTGSRTTDIELTYVTPLNKLIYITQVVNKDSTGLIASGSTYINNKLTATSNVTFNGDGSVNNGNTMRLMFCDGEGAYLSGSLYIVKAYNKALSITEINQNYNAVKSRFNI